MIDFGHHLSKRQALAKLTCGFSAALLIACAGTPVAAGTISSEPHFHGEGDDERTRKALHSLHELFANSSASGKHSCQILLVSEGVLRASPDNLELTSRSYGGRAGRAQVVATNSSYRLSIDQPLGFLGAPPGGNDKTAFVTSFSGVGAASFSDQPGHIPAKVKRGVTDIEAHLQARRDQPFPRGSYAAEITLRCE